MDAGLARGQPGTGPFGKEQEVGQKDVPWGLSQGGAGGLGDGMCSGNGGPVHTDPHRGQS